MIKSGVDIRGLQPQMAVAYTIACWTYWDHSLPSQCVITSASDGTHMANSLHYKGLALDLRTRDMDPVTRMEIVHDLKARLGAQFDVVIESDHLHVEFQPKDSLKGSEVA